MPRSSNRLPILGALAAFVLLVGCARGACCPPPCATPVAAAPEAAAQQEAAERLTLEQAVARTLERARDAEPRVTALLQGIAQESQGKLLGLQYRLKTPESTERKYRRMLEDDPSASPASIELYDALRYTIAIPEVQPGHHRKHARSLFQRCEAKGHTVEVVKNYWPRGDTYSGINATLRAPSGLLWELQVHTPESYATKSATHEDYEQMRDPATPIEEQQRLFAKMAALWEAVLVPEGMLEPKAVHPKEQMRHKKPPVAKAG